MWNQGKYGEASMAGYTQSPGGFGSPAASQGGDKKGRTRAQQIVPCTVSQLLSAVQAEDVFKVGEVEIAQVTIVGVIRSTDKSTINIQYKVDDMTAAPMDVKQWIDTEDMGVDNSVIPPGSYVKVSGNLRSFQNNRSLVAFSVRVLEDMNEVTSHMLEVVNAHLQQSKPQNMGGGGGMMPVSHTSMNSMGTTGGYSGANMMLVNGLSANQNQVLSLIKSCQEPQGISMHELKQKLNSMSANVIRQTVDFLSNEGHIFSTIDEDHFRSTDNEA
ncbi:replication protein A 32 kDa subunit [Danio rerio]|uniref:Replication factor A protein 2 n=1 Tax=Danio rerio TaxID=7955 RepID=Q504I6_DANRE|nr:replication protein A 32 kDa subunit [Danio rerio]AAH95005.1 Rpa2 protein [Danio rerio]AAI64047.1 Rpa2 protein [Danio rerio]|eukprot:NP_571786.2 replication protein A 32 kDa subunit [Danio rerio]